jgi:undecaprenyl-diphosphatase
MARQLIASIHALDVRTFIWCMSLKQRERLTRCSRYLSASADGPWYVLVTALLFMLEEELPAGLLQAMLLAVSIERAIYLVAKNLFKRNRPQDALGGFHSFIRPSDRFSFPSGHTSCAFLFASFMVLLFPQALLFWFSWAAAIGMSRVFLGVHFPTDTLVGAILGLTVANWAQGTMGL